MNFLNFLTSSASLFNFNLLPQPSPGQRQNTILVAPSKEIQSTITGSSTNPTLVNSILESEPEKPVQKEILTEQISQLLTQEQMLINQYMELQLKYLTTCLNMKENKIEEKSQPITKQEKSKQKVDADHQKQDHIALKKKIKKKNKCGHQDKIHYAKGMCNNCYHKYGRTKKPWNCTHDKLYAAGMCQNCYINNYNRKKREEKQGEGEFMNKFDIEELSEMEKEQ